MPAKNVAQFCCSLFNVAIHESSFGAVRSVAVFGLAVLFYGGVLPALGGTLARQLGTTGATIVALGLLFPYMLIFLATFHIADYVAYRDVFHADEPAPPSNPEAER